MLNSNKDNALVEKLIIVNKCTKVVKGGKNLSFGALVVVGDKKGRINFGVGKAREVADARNKAFASAKENKTGSNIPTNYQDLAKTTPSTPTTKSIDSSNKEVIKNRYMYLNS